MKKVANISEVLWVHWSTKAMAAVVAIQLLWAGMPASWLVYFPDWFPQSLAYLTAGLGLLSIGLKLLKQPLSSDIKQDIDSSKQISQNI